MTQKQKENFEHWLTNNLQVTSKSNVELIIKHVEHYFCPTPPQSIEEQQKAKQAIEYIGGLIKMQSKELEEKDKEIERLNEFYINFIKWKDDEANPFLMLKNGRYVQACGNSTEWTLSQLIELFKTSNS